MTRFLVNLGNWIALNYLFYYLTDGLGFTGRREDIARAGGKVGVGIKYFRIE